MLTERGVEFVYHYAPLHYLPFIARSRCLLSKPALIRAGFTEQHFRSTSRKQDQDRGFSEYIHLAVGTQPPILKTKLAAGFPHFELEIPARAVEQTEFHLCRFNIAKTRYFKGAKQEPPECPQNGYYYNGKRIPIAKTRADRVALFRANYGTNMIEVLVPHHLDLPDTTVVTVFSHEDEAIARRVLGAVDVPWRLASIGTGGYPRRVDYAHQVRTFIEQALHDHNWIGDALEFDRV